MSRGTKRTQQRQASPCRVYWGSHGCKKVRGHQGIHFCSCGERPPEGFDRFYGEDVQATSGIIP